MKLVDFEVLIDADQFRATSHFQRIESDLRTAIDHVRWPVGSSEFTIYPQSGKRRGEGNGVKPIKGGFITLLASRGWKPEAAYDEGGADATEEPTPGAFDAWLSLADVGLPPFVAEWETGNISSSHRAVNKIALGLIEGRLSGGVLALPTRRLYKFLTDRVGNIEELRPYFPFWKSLRPSRGLLAVISVEHDSESLDVPKIPKGTSGRAIG